MDRSLLEILACPICKGSLSYDKSKNELVCKIDKLAFPIEDNIPVLIVEQARKLEELGADPL